MRGTRVHAAILIAFISCSAAGQTGPPQDTQKPKVHGIDCQAPDPPAAGSTLYQDKVDGFEFMYPSFLHSDDSSLVFDDGPCSKSFHPNEVIVFRISLPPAYEEPEAVRFGEKDTSVETQVVNRLKWVKYSSRGQADDCTFSNHEQVCIHGGAIPNGGELSPALVKAMQEMESTFAFTVASSRLDARIAAVKAGDRFGSLTVRRVVTMAMEDRNPKRGYSGTYGEIYFTGSLKLVGSIENDGTMHSALWEFFPDGEDGSQTTVDLKLPFDPGKELLDRIEFKGGLDVGERMAKLPPSPNGTAAEQPVTIVVRNIAAIFNPGAGQSVVRADLVSMVPNY